MKIKYIPTSMFLFLLTISLSGQVVNDPFYVTGSDAIDPTGRAEVTFTAAGSTSESTLEALSGFGAVQDFGEFTGNASADDSRIFTFSNTELPAIRFTFSGNVNTSVSAALNNSDYSTSRMAFGSSLRMQPWTVEGNTIALKIDFGSYASDSFSTAVAGEGVSAVGFTLSGQYKNLSSGISITYLDALDNILSSQTLSQSSYETTTVAGYTGYQVSGGQDPIASVLISYELDTSSAIFGFDDLGFTTYQNIPEVKQTTIGITASLIVILSVFRRSRRES